MSRRLFGVQSVRDDADDRSGDHVGRLGAERKSMTGSDWKRSIQSSLAIKVVCHSIPIRPGRNLAIIVESAAVNHRQKQMGYNAAQELYKRVQENLAKERR